MFWCLNRRGSIVLGNTGKNILAGRTFHLSHCIAVCQSKMENTTQPKEFMIPAPFGHIAGKVWNEGGTPLLSLHGWMDNAGTWDGVAPLLPSNISVVAIDFPGHGLSSSLPPGKGSMFIDLLLIIERVIQHFGWKKVNLLGHSMGGGASMLYAGTFPEKINKLIMVDMIKPVATPAENQAERTARSIRELLEVETKMEKNVPCYEYSSMVSKLIKGYNFSITEESAKILLKRGSVKHPNGLYSFNFDPRLKIPSIFGMTFEQQKEFANRLNCELMIIKASEGASYESKDHYDEIILIYEKRAKIFIYKEVEGTHHVHINDPQIIAQIIVDFIQA